MPTPRTTDVTRPPVMPTSSLAPATLRDPITTSFGHLTPAGMPSAQIASVRASDATKEKIGTEAAAMAGRSNTDM